MSKKGIAVDIDDTLSVTTYYYFEKMLQLFGNPEQLTVNEAINRYRYSYNVPYWQNDDARIWISKHRDNPDTILNLPTMPGAIKFLSKINEICPVVAYITVREESVYEPTRAWLEKNGFPEATLLMRPTELEHKKGSAWKASQLLKKYPEAIGIIDDSLHLVDELSHDYTGTLFLYSHESYIGEKKFVTACLSWQNVYSSVKKQLE